MTTRDENNDQKEFEKPPATVPQDQMNEPPHTTEVRFQRSTRKPIGRVNNE